jgi:hypothetical protein
MPPPPTKKQGMKSKQTKKNLQGLTKMFEFMPWGGGGDVTVAAETAVATATQAHAADYKKLNLKF